MRPDLTVVGVQLGTIAGRSLNAEQHTIEDQIAEALKRDDGDEARRLLSEGSGLILESITLRTRDHMRIRCDRRGMVDFQGPAGSQLRLLTPILLRSFRRAFKVG